MSNPNGNEKKLRNNGKKGPKKINTAAIVPRDGQIKKALKVFQGTRLTPKMRRWFYEYVTNGGNATAAARIAYPNVAEASLWNIGFQNVRKLKAPLDVLADLMGISDAKVMAVLSEGLSATRTVTATHQGKITDEREYIDHPARRSFAELIMKARGQLLDRSEVAITTTDVGDFDGHDAAGYIEKILSGS